MNVNLAAIVNDPRAAATTPDEWLLADYDAHARSRIRPATMTQHVRPLAQILNDHKGAECEPHPAMPSSDCRWWSGAASWPTPRIYNDITERRAA